MQNFLDENAKPNLEQKPEAPAPSAMNITGEGLGAVQQNPLTESDENASPEEQAEYEDAFRRIMAMIHDTRENNGKKSMADSLIKTLANSQLPSHVAIGQSAGNTLRLFHENAKRQGKEIPGDVLREIGMDVIVEFIDIARETGAVKQLPEDESVEMRDFANQAALEAAKHFGEYMLKTGQADVQGEQEAYKEQMEREATSGALDDWNMQGMDQGQMEQAVADKGGFA